MEHEGSTFLCGCAPFFDLIFFAKEADEFSKQDIENSSFFIMSGDNWGKYTTDAAWTAISMATIKPPTGERVVVAVAPHGAYWEVSAETLVELTGQIPGVGGPLRALKAIDDEVYAFGMGRTLLRRGGPGEWTELGAGASAGGNAVVGFEDIAAPSHDEIYAVGWHGEIWRRMSGSWQQLDSPVDANLNAICCDADGYLYVVGDNGVMLRGRGDSWDILDTERPENLLDVAVYGDCVYVVTDFKILKKGITGQLVEENDFLEEDDRPSTCLHLLQACDGVVSMGTKDLFYVHEGPWRRLV